eukprot:TRINITY_DN6835_c0_g1_i2.p1 TRINITY_DN6835_c0_g1~~TRINITY_DN6835_c0_g1_i2.p1  ORF type:complete len:130 (+),score=30.09 TRINITY_DN6835_c0_g1_i2:78-467(+)
MALAAKHEFQMSSMQQETESKRSLSTETNAPLQSDEPLQIVDEDLANDLVNDLSGCSVDTHSTSKISTFPSNTMTSSAKDIQSFQVLDYATDSAFSQDWRASSSYRDNTTIRYLVLAIAFPCPMIEVHL